MGLFDFLLKDASKDYNKELFFEEAKNLGLTTEEANEAYKSGLSPEEWLEENDYENYKDQELDK